MAINVALKKNLVFWHWYPELLVQGLTPAQLAWQPDGHDTSIIFAIWHAYRAEDELLHGMVMQRPSVFASEGWAERLPVAQTGRRRSATASRANRSATSVSTSTRCSRTRRPSARAR